MQVKLDRLEYKDLSDNQDPRVNKDPPVNLGLLVPQDNQDQQEVQGPQVH